MAYYAVAHYTVTDPETYRQYPPAAIPSIYRHGGRILAVAGAGMARAGLPEPQAIEKTAQHAMTVLMEFASQAALERWYQSPEYQAAIGLRVNATDGWFIGLPAYQRPE